MTTIAEVLEKKYTVEEYLELEKTSETKHEYYHGNLIPVAGEKKKANRIANNINLKLSPTLLEKGFDVFMHDVKAAVKPGFIYRYPDYMVALPEDEDEYLVFEPILAVEVASEDSASRDRGKKLDEYTHLPSMQYYLIVYQEEMLLEFYARDGEQWTLCVFSQATDSIDLPVFGLQLNVEDIYSGVKLEVK
jgi:Uma2 family endonuclease